MYEAVLADVCQYQVSDQQMIPQSRHTGTVCMNVDTCLVKLKIKSYFIQNYRVNVPMFDLVKTSNFKLLLNSFSIDEKEVIIECE